MNCVVNLKCRVGMLLLLTLFATEASAQLVYQQQMDKYSAILPLTLNDDVYRVRATPPEGVAPIDVNCDIGITGTVLTDQRGTSASDAGEKVLSSLMHKDKVDVMFSDRVFTGHHTLTGDRIIGNYDFDCGINIKYQNKKKVAQLEIRVGYVLPSGDVEGLTWTKIRRKIRLLGQNIAKCERCDDGISGLDRERSTIISSAEGGNQVQVMRANARLSGIARQIDRLHKYKSQEGDFRRDLAAFASLEEYLKTKVNGTQVYVHFHHDGQTLPVNVEELKRARIRPIQVFEETKDPIKNGG
jgi:hypothetical protein